MSIRIFKFNELFILNRRCGGMTRNKGVPVYKFKDGDEQYWLWDGTASNPPFGSLEGYEKEKLCLQLECARQLP